MRKNEELSQLYKEEDTMMFIKKDYLRRIDDVKSRTDYLKGTSMIDPVELDGKEDLACVGWMISKMTSL